ncbi:GTP binding protein 1 [Capsaspora owczarzaki ATCC 30864]|uniref:GTP binding protein 1 n=1 Tax=Capsaspora owczarzaki (strain ATCC 30864) TaxID=595528 RepID=A0A0D2VT64_CAPO3|nr:GTP binding protein 1 [Capsaspora owczarzaki ATCC 30864]KJE94417.1 GTP binding protein 1 [Capsaspora owczarzaki ATCC 30864]|eukprot:XP_004346745.2 GTP binding protein 1 [Capsaspora owczarzaki ATCC 30864]
MSRLQHKKDYQKHSQRADEDNLNALDQQDAFAADDDHSDDDDGDKQERDHGNAADDTNASSNRALNAHRAHAQRVQKQQQLDQVASAMTNLTLSNFNPTNAVATATATATTASAGLNAGATTGGDADGAEERALEQQQQQQPSVTSKGKGPRVTATTTTAQQQQPKQKQPQKQKQQQKQQQRPKQELGASTSNNAAASSSSAAEKARRRQDDDEDDDAADKDDDHDDDEHTESDDNGDAIDLKDAAPRDKARQEVDTTDDATLLLDPKLQLVNPDAEDTAFLLRQLRARLQESQGETIYEVGVADGGSSGLTQEQLDQSVATLRQLAIECKADISLLREKQADAGTVAEYLVRRRMDDESDFIEVRVAVVGNVDAGKSTLLGVLTHGELDNGRGKSRLRLFRHKHEADTGRTSSISHNILGFDSQGRIVNAPDEHTGGLDWTLICERASKVLTFIDLAGHERYLKTTVFGLTGHVPDFAMLMVGANAGLIGMSKEHLGLALALNVPVIVVVTKIDMCPPNVLKETMNLLVKILKSPGCRKIPLVVANKDDVVVTATNFMSERVCPIFQISNVTGENLDLLKMFLNLISPRREFDPTLPAQFQIDETYSVPGVGTVISGTVMAGVIRSTDTLYLGPDTLGNFQPVQLKTIQRKRLPVRDVRAGQAASFALKKIKRSAIRKGMVLLAKDAHLKAYREFEAELLILHHPTTISTRYQAMVHCGSIRQTASILSMDRELLRTGDKARVRLRFLKHPEFVRIGARLVFREGRTKAVGTVTQAFEIESHPMSVASAIGSASVSASSASSPPGVVAPTTTTSSSSSSLAGSTTMTTTTTRS